MTGNKAFKNFEKCATYTVLSILTVNTINAMARFRRVPADKIMTDVYTKLKEKAAAVNA